eukprot:415629_1
MVYCDFVRLCDFFFDTMTTGIFDKIDNLLAIHYKKCGRNDYFDENNQGKFRAFVDLNCFEEDTIELEVGSDIEPDDCLFIGMDDNFPLIGQYTIEERNKEIFKILKRYYKSPAHVALIPFDMRSLNERIIQQFSTRYGPQQGNTLATKLVQYFIYHQFDEWYDVVNDINSGYNNCCCKCVLFEELNITNIEQKHNEYQQLKQCLKPTIISTDSIYQLTNIRSSKEEIKQNYVQSEWDICSEESKYEVIKSKTEERCWQCLQCSAINNLLISAKIYNYSCCRCRFPYNVDLGIIYCNEWIEVQNNRWECNKCTYSNNLLSIECWICKHPKQDQDIDCKQANENETCSNYVKFNVNDIIYNLDEKCDIHSCLAAEKVPTLMINYKNNATCTFDNKHLLKHYLHILSAHNTSQDFEHIYNKLMKQDGCDIKHCKIFKRHQRRRINFIYESSNIRENVNQNINDKIHCYYYHSYDIGYKLTKTEESYLSHNSENDDMCSSVTNCDRIALNELLSAKHKLYKIICDVKSSATSKFVSNFDFETPNIQIEDNYNVYSYGYEFVYQLKSDYKGNIITKNYNTLKEEMTQNNTSKLGMKQFDHELKKAEMHYYEEYRKKYMPYMLIEHLLAVMIYCNFTVLQNALSKTYRKQNKNESFEQLVERHSDFYWLGKYLKEAALQFGTYIKDGIVTSFYHGINQEVMFPRIFASNGIKIYCPLST